MLSLLKVFGLHSAHSPEFQLGTKSQAENVLRNVLDCVIGNDLEEAVKLAADSNGLLFIVFHDPNAADSRDFIDKVLCDKKFVDYLNEVSFKTVQVMVFDVSNFAHREVARQFGINSCPAVVIKTKLQSKFQTVLSYEGFLEVRHIVGLVQSVLLAAEAEYAQAEELNSIRSLQREQDEAYRRSVEADLAKRRSRTVSSEVLEETTAVSPSLTSDPGLNNRIMQAKNAVSDASEPYYRIQFNLPNGSRKIATFGRDAKSKNLFDHLFANEDLTSTAVIIKSIDPVFEFRDDENAQNISEIQGLGKNFKLFVEYL